MYLIKRFQQFSWWAHDAIKQIHIIYFVIHVVLNFLKKVLKKDKKTVVSTHFYLTYW